MSTNLNHIFKLSNCQKYVPNIKNNIQLDTEFFKLLQNSDQHSEEYRGRLRNNALVVKILKTGVIWADLQKDQQQLYQMYLLVIKYIYYRHATQMQDGGVENAEIIMDKYCKFIYTNDETQRIRTQVWGQQDLFNYFFEQRSVFKTPQWSKLGI